jgi:hypothetical protein
MVSALTGLDTSGGTQVSQVVDTDGEVGEGIGPGNEVIAVGRATRPWTKYQMATLSANASVLLPAGCSRAPVVPS